MRIYELSGGASPAGSCARVPGCRRIERVDWAPLNLRELASIVWRRRYLVLLVVVLCAAFGAVFAFSKGEKYESKATVAVTPDVRTRASSRGKPHCAARQLRGDRRIVGGPRAGGGGARAPPRRRRQRHQRGGTAILEISARADDPVVAQEAAQAVTDAFVAGTNPDAVRHRRHHRSLRGARTAPSSRGRR